MVFQWYFYHGFGHFSSFNVQICSCCAHRPSAKTLVSVPRNPPLPEEAIKYFSSLSQTMLSLFMSISGGVSWEELVFPLQDWLHITWSLHISLDISLLFDFGVSFEFLPPLTPCVYKVFASKPRELHHWHVFDPQNNNRTSIGPPGP